MIDELDLEFDDRGDKGRHRRGYVSRRKKGREPKRGGRGKTVVALLMSLVLLGVLGGGVWYGFDRIQGFFTTPDYDGPGTGEAIVEVKSGDNVADVGNTLVAADVVKSAQAYIEAADNERGRGVQVGRFKLRKQMKAADALTMLLDPKSRVTNGITIPEGKITLTIFDALAKHTKIPVADFKEAAKDPVALGVPEFWFKRENGKTGTKSLEGFLFPATYEFPPKATAEEILGIMVEKFLEVTKEMNFVDTVQRERKISPYEALIVASLAQAEAGHPDDLGKIARVAYNRMYSGNHYCKNGNGLTGCLEFDVGVNYYWMLTGQKTKTSGQMTDTELFDKKNPYRMHGKAGLPPTPINNPGEKALEGAMNPPKGDWLFFVAIDKEGHSEFATTSEEHERNIQKARENGVF